ncbi:hypothetical protein QUF74_06945 [Candidatus Halobeggiatoa sp. HSG11]|nr:hypothetical protein [Candidatus Halobeggiatoa sp. HSG11]
MKTFIHIALALIIAMGISGTAFPSVGDNDIDLQQMRVIALENQINMEREITSTRRGQLRADISTPLSTTPGNPNYTIDVPGSYTSGNFSMTVWRELQADGNYLLLLRVIPTEDKPVMVCGSSFTVFTADENGITPYSNISLKDDNVISSGGSYCFGEDIDGDSLGDGTTVPLTLIFGQWSHKKQFDNTKSLLILSDDFDDGTSLEIPDINGGRFGAMLGGAGDSCPNVNTSSSGNTPVSSDCMANHFTSGQLHVPCVSVPDTSTVYDIKLNQQTGSFTFDLDMDSVKPKDMGSVKPKSETPPLNGEVSGTASSTCHIWSIPPPIGVEEVSIIIGTLTPLTTACDLSGTLYKESGSVIGTANIPAIPPSGVTRLSHPSFEELFGAWSSGRAHLTLESTCDLDGIMRVRPHQGGGLSVIPLDCGN